MAASGRNGGIGRRALLASAIALAGAVACPGMAALAQQVRFFRIGAGPAGGTLFRSAGWICAAISNPPGSRPCEKNGSCGVPGMIALAQSTEGGFANLKALRERALDAGIAYADMAHDALAGKGEFKTAGPFPELCAVTALAPESLHILVRRGGGIRKVADLKGKRIAIGAEASDPAALTALVLRLHGISRRAYKAVPLNPEAAASALAEGRVDAMIFLARPPSAVARQMMQDHGGMLLPLAAARVNAAVEANPFLSASVIPSAAYGTADPIPSLATVPVLLVRREMDADLVTALSRALWLAMKNDDVHPLDDAAFATAQIKRRGVPLHPAAQAFRDGLAQQDSAMPGAR
ncbi:MAG: TAXI family TRAP transporter solute-binding subunit [Rhodospirillaceae bacterium]